MDKIDFFIPLHKYNFTIRIVVEGIIKLHHPRIIYIVTPKKELPRLESSILDWKGYDNQIFCFEDEKFFMEKYYLDKETIEKWYCKKDEQSREFGWWYQQILKLGAVNQIQGISDPYIVWDSDLIPLEKWKLYDEATGNYKFAILQEFSKNEWNKEQYASSIFDLTGIKDVAEPLSGGTFVPHHFVLYHQVIKSFLTHIETYSKNRRENNHRLWIECIVYLSHDYYRFSEYKCIANYMLKNFKHLLDYHPFSEYGEKGIRFRESEEIVEEIKKYFDMLKINEIGYDEMVDFCKSYFWEAPSYIQLEHVDF
jgi:hypothetical protein